jgi:hypothetical protein
VLERLGDPRREVDEDAHELVRGESRRDSDGFCWGACGASEARLRTRPAVAPNPARSPRPTRRLQAATMTVTIANATVATARMTVA